MRKLLGKMPPGNMGDQGAPESYPRPHITQELLARSERLAPDSSSNLYRVDKNTVVKIGDAVRVAEATAMRLVREKTSMPVPEVFDAFVQEESGHGCIVMEYIDGVPLGDDWDSYDNGQKTCIISQLKGFLEELRAVSGKFVGSVDGTYCEDQFFSCDRKAYGPFESEEAFHKGLVRALLTRGQNTWTDMVCRFIKDMPKHSIVLTHGDLAARNILVRKVKVVGIIDWEYAGFYPAYWECVKALLWPDWQSSWISDGVVDRVLQPYLLELAYLLHAREIIWYNYSKPNNIILKISKTLIPTRIAVSLYLSIGPASPQTVQNFTTSLAPA